MTIARTVADVLSGHVRFEVECIDRMYLNVYQPKLQYAAGLVGYVQRQLGLPIASTAPLAKITDRFTAAVDRLADRREIAITLLWQDAVVTEGRGHAVAPSGRAFLERRRAMHAVTDERRAAGDAFAAQLAADLAVDQADVRHESCPSAEVALSMSLLAARDEADALKVRATVAAGGIDGVRAVVSGPWPPYSFTEELGSGRGR
jgi:hypothetical protein